MTTFLDAHCHLQDPRVDLVRESWLAQAKESALSQFVLGGVGPEDWDRQIALDVSHPNTFYLTAGLHPWWVSAHSDAELSIGLSALREKFNAEKSTGARWLGLGETGLDYQDRFSEIDRDRQRTAFVEQLRVAAEFQKPLVLHVVRAHAETLSILDSCEATGGMVHSFSGDLATAKAYLKKGFLLSISAAVLTRGSGKAFRSLEEVVVGVGLSELLIETDSPDQPPADQKGQLNSVQSLFRVAEVIGKFRGCSSEEVLTASAENWKRKFIPHLFT